MSAAEHWSPAGWKPGPLLPRNRSRDFALHFVVATLCFLACLAALGMIAADRAAQGWSRDIRSEATVQVMPKPGETGAAAAARAAEALAGVRGVAEAAALEREKAEALLEPWLGNTSLEDLPIPHLVTVRLDPVRPATAAELKRALSAAGVEAAVDDHSRWMADIERVAVSVRLVALAVFALMTAAAGAVIAFATRTGMAAASDVVEVLHLSGAKDDFIAGLFQWRYARLAAVAGLYGSAAAALLAAGLILFGGGGGFTPALPLQWIDLAAVSPCALVAATVAAVAARLTTLRLLREIA
ncbi:MAG TPA: ABC transporter permease [Caulobacteraceae bacterium]|nr:ABC transporter permease [Caulobacteraceae bacterium]